MKNLVTLTYSCILISLLSSCQPAGKAHITVDQSSFNAFWNALDTASRNVLIENILAQEGIIRPSAETIRAAASSYIDSTLAGQYTRNYVNSLPPNERDSALKSVYFSLEDLEAFTGFIHENCNGSGNVPGLRIYLARYGNGMSPSSLNNRLTVVLRATCDYDDIPHFGDEVQTKNFVAWNYGDACPPRCKQNQLDAVVCTGGGYRTDGPFVYNCQ